MDLPIAGIAERLKHVPLYYTIPAIVVAPPVLLITFLVTYISILIPVRLFQAFVLKSSTYSNIPAPRHASKWFPIFGDLGAVRSSPPFEAHLAWTKELNSKVISYRRMFYAENIYLADARAMNHVLGPANSYSYPKPDNTRRFLSELLGHGVLVTEGDEHKRQRKILQPAFNVSAIRGLTPTFFKHAARLVDRIGGFIDSSEGPSEEPFIPGQTVMSAKASQKGKPVLDVGLWTSKATLDIIGETGFDHDFKTISSGEDDDDDELALAFHTLMKQTGNLTIWSILQFGLQTIPGFNWIRILPTRRRRLILDTYKILERKSNELLLAKRAEIAADMKNAMQDDSKAYLDGIAKGKDILYLMMRANMATDLPPSERLEDDQLVGQITTFIFAGHETTSTLTQWALYILSLPQHKDIQDKLRAELEENFAGRDEIPYDSLMAIPYLDNFSKELMRRHSPVGSTTREAQKDDVIPLSKSYPTRNGKSTFNSVVVKKGSEVMIPIQVLNRSEDVWGPTAHDFNPDRWDNIPATAKESGLPSHMLTFIAGPRSCIGNRFSVAEFKVIISALVRAFRIEAVEGWEVEAKQGIVVRPRIVGQEEVGLQMPLRLSRL